MQTTLLSIIPVLSSADIGRDLRWYREKTGFETHVADSMYAVLYRENLVIHLQWHADTPEDPLLGGSVIRIAVSPIGPFFEELVGRGAVSAGSLRMETPWKTHEFGLFDLNGNALFFMEDLG